MIEFIPRILSFLFVIIIYLFILRVIRMVYTDIRVLSRKKDAADPTVTYIKLINLRDSLDFPVSESYGIIKDTIIGRGKACDIIIDDPFLSAEHAEILVRDGGHYLYDMESTNGTFLNGKAVTGDPIELIGGDRVEIGQLSLVFMTGSGEA